MSIRAVLFDVFGTLLDVHSVGARADQLFPGHGQRLSQLWREKQIEYTRLRTMSSRYVPFTQVTEDALQFACEALALPLDAAARGLLMHEYTQLAPYADVVPALRPFLSDDEFAVRSATIKSLVRVASQDALDALLMSGEPHEDAMDVATLDGFLAALAIGPNHVEATRWLPEVWGGDAAAAAARAGADAARVWRGGNRRGCGPGPGLHR